MRSVVGVYAHTHAHLHVRYGAYAIARLVNRNCTVRRGTREAKSAGSQVIRQLLGRTVRRDMVLHFGFGCRMEAISR